MKHCTRGYMAEKLRQYNRSDLHQLSDCYLNYSTLKLDAYRYCIDLMQKYNGCDLRIIGFNTFHFSVGFIGKINGNKAFFYITAHTEQYIYIN